MILFIFIILTLHNSYKWAFDFFSIFVLSRKQNHAILSINWKLAIHSFNCFNTLGFKTSFTTGWPILLDSGFLYIFYLFLDQSFLIPFLIFSKNSCILLFQLFFLCLYFFLLLFWHYYFTISSIKLFFKIYIYILCVCVWNLEDILWK